jgi:hypothetical protein
MKSIENTILQKKRKTMLKNLQNKMPNFVKGANRSLAETIDIRSPIEKIKYREQAAKLSDRLVPYLKSYGEVEALLQVLEGDLSLKEGRIEITKMINSENGSKLVIEVSI